MKITVPEFGSVFLIIVFNILQVFSIINLLLFFIYPYVNKIPYFYLFFSWMPPIQYTLHCSSLITCEPFKN